MKKLNLGFLALGLAISSVLFTISARAVEPLTLKVALYPYVPDRYAVFALLAREFQRRKENEGVTLELVEPEDEYYSGGLLKLDAHVYEIDSILLSDMLPKIAPLTVSLSGFSPESIEAVTRNGVVYALPHSHAGMLATWPGNETTYAQASSIVYSGA